MWRERNTIQYYTFQCQLLSYLLSAVTYAIQKGRTNPLALESYNVKWCICNA